jgi:acyl-CoA thioester hydrolase
MTSDKAELPQLAAFPVISTEKTRFGDTDAFGHINNAVISTFLESGRSELLRVGGEIAAAKGCHFLLASVTIDFRGELNWPGEVVIGSRVTKLGRTSLGFDQAIFQQGGCRVVSRSTLVQVNAELKTSAELTSEARAHFATLCGGAAGSVTGQ